MRCPYFVDRLVTGMTPHCIGAVVPFEPSPINRAHFCTSGRHRHCPLYRYAGHDLSLDIHREVARAIG